MSKTLPAAERLRAETAEVFAGGEDLPRAIEGWPSWARIVVQCALEDEVKAFSGRDRYQRAATSEDPRAGCTNGYCPTTVETTAGPITLERPKPRNTAERFASQLFGKHVLIGRLPGEHSCLSLVWAVLDRASAGWHGFAITPTRLRLLQDLRRALHNPSTQLPQWNSAEHAKQAWRKTIPRPSHRICERSLPQAAFTTHLRRHRQVAAHQGDVSQQPLESTITSAPLLIHSVSRAPRCGQLPAVIECFEERLHD